MAATAGFKTIINCRLSSLETSDQHTRSALGPVVLRTMNGSTFSFKQKQREMVNRRLRYCSRRTINLCMIWYDHIAVNSLRAFWSLLWLVNIDRVRRSMMVEVVSTDLYMSHWRPWKVTTCLAVSKHWRQKTSGNSHRLIILANPVTMLLLLLFVIRPCHVMVIDY